MSKLVKDVSGDAAVEAAILFPIIIMAFAALVLLAMYLPTRAALQRATQYAATAIATVKSDSWLGHDNSEISYYWESDKSKLKNVYVELFSDGIDVKSMGRSIVTEIEGRSLSSKAGELDVDSYIVNKLVYKEVVVEAMRDIPVPVDLSLISFPETIPVTVTSTAVILDGDEFVRNMDMAVDFIEFLIEKLELDDLSDTISSFGSKVSSIFGW